VRKHWEAYFAPATYICGVVACAAIMNGRRAMASREDLEGAEIRMPAL